ncbi:MAG: diguanylate cyclase [Gammaproteobacteria bacterium]|jgi:diguanylate cyclase (GGDEF)-like protein
MPKYRYFLKIFLPLTVITIIIIFLLCYIETKNYADKMTVIAMSTVNSENKIFNNTIDIIQSDALFLKKEVEMEYEENRQQPFSHLIKHLNKTFMSFSKNRRIYDQVRFIRIDGQELVRINNRNKIIQAVPKTQLQNKKHRYYFIKSAALNNNAIYFSPLDLNIEHQKIERPFRPMIRIGTPVYNKEGVKLGVIILNYNAQYLLDSLKHGTASIPGNLFLIDNNGHFLMAPNANYTWGNSIPSRRNITIATIFPHLWQHLIRDKQSSKLYTRYGIFFIKNFTSEPSVFKHSDLKLILLWRIYWQQILPITLKYYLVILAILLIAIIFISRFWSLLKIKRVEYEKQLELFATTDPLTGTYNRRTLLKAGTRECERSQRTGKTFSALMFDIDHFKKVNDTYGHLNGDQALIAIAKTAKDTIRKIDILARFGGEEFVIIMPETSLEKAISLAQRLHQKIAQIKIPLIDNHQQFFSLTVSIGISSWHKDDTNIDSVINRADQQLYRAKINGRNQIMVDN